MRNQEINRAHSLEAEGRALIAGAFMALSVVAGLAITVAVQLGWLRLF